MPPRSLLVISAAPDDRPSTAMLLLVVAELRRRSGVRTHLWFLREGNGDVAPADRVIDDLRMSRPAALAETMGLGPVARFLRGRMMRRWWNQARPDSVLLDDGLGARVIGGRPVTTVVRVNGEPHADAALEDAALASPDVWMVTRQMAERPAGEVVDEPVLLWDLHEEVAYAAPGVRRDERRRLGLPEDEPLVIGWGSDASLDGVDVFIRSLWALEHHGGVVAHGLWIGLVADAEEQCRLEGEVRRCGLEGRVTHLSDDGPSARLCGDVVLLPYRCAYPVGRPPMREVLVTGAQVVSTEATGLHGHGVSSIPDLDAEAAAVELARCLADDRRQVAMALGRKYHVGPLVDDLLGALDRVG